MAFVLPPSLPAASGTRPAAPAHALNVCTARLPAPHPARDHQICRRFDVASDSLRSFSSSIVGQRLQTYAAPRRPASGQQVVVFASEHHKAHTPKVDPRKYQCSTGDRIVQIIACILFIGCIDAGFSGDWPLTEDQTITAQHIATAWAAANALFAVAAARAVRSSGPQEVLWYICKGLLAGAPVMLELRKREMSS